MAVPSRFYWPLAVVLIFLTGCLFAAYVVNHMLVVSATVVNSVGDSLSPRNTYITSIRTALGQLHNVRHLIVLQAEIDADITKSKETRIIWGKIYLGKTTIRLRAHDNQVQFYLPLEKFTDDDVRFDEAHQILHITLPQPVLDDQMVDVQSDPAQIEVETDVGWASLQQYEGHFVQEEAQRDLRPVVLREAANNPLLRKKVEDEGIKVFRDDLATRLSSALGHDWVVDISYKK